MRILLVEDEKKRSSFIQRGLEGEGWSVDAAFDGDEGFEKLRSGSYDIVLLDLMLPKRSGIEVLKDARELEISTPVLILTAKDSLESKMEGFRAGTDDYLTKPFHFEELIARINALTRRTAQPEMRLSVADLTLDLHTHRVTRGTETIELTSKEFPLLEYMMRNADKVLTRAMIAENAWHESFDRNTNLVDVYVMYLRKKLDENHEPKLIHTVRGTGYVFGVREAE